MILYYLLAAKFKYVKILSQIISPLVGTFVPSFLHQNSISLANAQPEKILRSQIFNKIGTNVPTSGTIGDKSIFIQIGVIFLFLLKFEFYGQKLDHRSEEWKDLHPSVGRSGSQWDAFQPQTNRIKIKFDSSMAITKINIFPCLIEWRYYPLWEWRNRKNNRLMNDWDSIYLKRKPKDSIYGTVPVLENFYRKRIDIELQATINRYVPDVKSTILNSKDSVFLRKEMAFLNEQFNDTLLLNYKISDSLYSFLGKFPGEQHILYNVFAAHFDVRELSIKSLIWFSRVFVIDMRKAKVVYYTFKKVFAAGGDYKDKQGQHYTRALYFMPNPDLHFPLLNRSLKGYLRYLKKNEKYLNEKGVKWK